MAECSNIMQIKLHNSLKIKTFLKQRYCINSNAVTPKGMQIADRKKLRLAIFYQYLNLSQTQYKTIWT